MKIQLDFLYMCKSKSPEQEEEEEEGGGKNPDPYIRRSLRLHLIGTRGIH
jgi:hypothetical protein